MLLLMSCSLLQEGAHEGLKVSVLIFAQVSNGFGESKRICCYMLTP